MTRKPPATTNTPAPPGAFDTACGVVLLGVLSARPLLAETYHRIELGVLAGVDTSGPTPATTAILDWLVLALAGVTLIRCISVPNSRVFRVGCGALLLAAVVSTVAAGNMYAARLAVATPIALVLAGAALAIWAAQQPWRRHVLIAALLAVGVTTAYQCLQQHYYEIPAMRQMWEEEQKPALLAQGYAPDDPMLVNFERRAAAAEPHGFLAHPNITASVLAMLGVVALAAGLAGLALRGPSPVPPTAAEPKPHPLRGVAAVLFGAIAILISAGLILTGSLGAIAAGVGGLLALLVLYWQRRRVATRPVTWLLAIASLYVGGCTAIAVYGVTRGTLPHPSLAFRWFYWTTAVEAYADAPLTGLGRENFAASYMRYKPVESTEEVQNPHNLWLSLLAELGPLGLLGGTALLATTVLAALRRLMSVSASSDVPGRSEWRWFALLVGVLAITHLLCSAAYASGAAYAIIWFVDIVGVWAAAAALAFWLLPACERSAAAWIQAGLLAALLVALLHAVLSFALLTAGGLTVLVLCAAAAAAPTAPEMTTTMPRARRIGVAVLVFLLLAVHAATVRAAWGSDQQATRLQELLRNPRVTPTALAQQATRMLTKHHGDPATLRRGIQTLTQLGQSAQFEVGRRLTWLQAAEAQLATLLELNPVSHGAHRQAAQTETALAEAHAAAGDAAAARAYRQRAAERWTIALTFYPTNSRSQLAAGEAWLAVYRDTQAPADAARARGHLEAAVAIEATRTPEEANRLGQAERARLSAALQALPAEPS